MLSSLVKHSHQHLVSLVNLQITPRNCKVILKVLGRSKTLRSLSHVTVEVAGYIGRRGAKYFSRNFENGVDTTSRLLAKCPALTSVGISEANECSFGLTLAKLFKRSMGTLANLRCLSIQLAFAKFDVAQFTGSMVMASVVNLRVCTHWPDTFSQGSFLTDIIPFFPNVELLYIAYRFIHGEACYLRMCGSDGRRKGYEEVENLIQFPESLQHSLITLALDRCFVSEENVKALQTFKQLDKLIVCNATDELYNIGNLDSRDRLVPILQAEDIGQYKELLYRDSESSSPAASRVRIALEERAMESATNWTSIIPSSN